MRTPRRPTSRIRAGKDTILRGSAICVRHCILGPKLVSYFSQGDTAQEGYPSNRRNTRDCGGPRRVHSQRIKDAATINLSPRAARNPASIPSTRTSASTPFSTSTPSRSTWTPPVSHSSSESIVSCLSKRHCAKTWLPGCYDSPSARAQWETDQASPLKKSMATLEGVSIRETRHRPTFVNAAISSLA